MKFLNLYFQGIIFQNLENISIINVIILKILRGFDKIIRLVFPIHYIDYLFLLGEP